MIKLIPIAKPVRYTIKSGGRDCADLNDLLKSFNVDDLRKIDIKQLHEWAKRRCANVPSIAEKLSKQPSELEYYQIFYQHDFKDLHAAWKWLKAYGEYKESANTLYHVLINRGDKETISDILKDKSAEDIIQLISSGDIDANSVVLDHKEFFNDLASDIIKDEPKAQDQKFKVLTILADSGITCAEDYVKKTSSFTTEEFSDLLLYVLDYEGNYSLNSYLAKKFGSKINSLPKNLIDFYHAAFYCVPESYEGDKKQRYKMALQRIGSEEPRSNERQFFRMILEDKSGKNNSCAYDENALREKSYPFMSIFNKNHWYRLPKELQDFLSMKWDFRFSIDQMSDRYFIDFLRIYFTYFLKPKYFNGKLEDL